LRHNGCNTIIPWIIIPELADGRRPAANGGKEFSGQYSCWGGWRTAEEQPAGKKIFHPTGDIESFTPCGTYSETGEDSLPPDCLPSNQTWVGFYFFLNDIGIFGVVADDVLQVDEVLRLNSGEFETYLAIAGSNHLPKNIHPRPHAWQKDGEFAWFPRLEPVFDFHLTTAHAEIHYTFNRINSVIHREFCPYIEENPTKPSFFYRHEPIPLEILESLPEKRCTIRVSLVSSRVYPYSSSIKKFSTLPSTSKKYILPL
jgi:hypothetical protein